MYSLHPSLKIPITTLLVAGSLLLGVSSHANVYATNIRLNDTQTGDVNTTQGSSVSISYLLNDNATAGVTIKILSGTTAVRTINILTGAGTVKGSNSVAWDGKNDSAQNVPAGSYSVSVTAAHSGYSDWTQISDDNAASSYCNRPRGIAINKNINSPFYGRIFIGNSQNGPNVGTQAWGDVPGIYKVNADGSYSDDGSGRFGTAGYPFTGAAYYDGGDNPINMKVEQDDRLYWNNWVGDGEVTACDMLLTTNQVVMPEAGYSANPYYPSDNWKSFDITDAGTTNARIYLADANYPSAGIWWWPLTNGAADIVNSPVGNQALATGGDVPLRCDGVAVDANTNVYVAETRSNTGDPAPRAICFTNWDGQSTLISGAAWTAGSADSNFRDVYNLSLDSAQNPHYIAFGMYSTNVGIIGIRILNVTDGSTVVTNLSAGVGYHGVNWDAAGNLYGGAQLIHRWRVWSPPGANQATTPALATLQIAAGATPPNISKATVSGGTVSINFTADVTDLPTTFHLLSASVVTGPFTDTGATATLTGPGTFNFTVPVNGAAQFYRISR